MAQNATEEEKNSFDRCVIEVRSLNGLGCEDKTSLLDKFVYYATMYVRLAGRSELDGRKGFRNTVEK